MLDKDGRKPAILAETGHWYRFQQGDEYCLDNSAMPQYILRSHCNVTERHAINPFSEIGGFDSDTLIRLLHCT